MWECDEDRQAHRHTRTQTDGRDHDTFRLVIPNANAESLLMSRRDGSRANRAEIHLYRSVNFDQSTNGGRNLSVPEIETLCLIQAKTVAKINLRNLFTNFFQLQWNVPAAETSYRLAIKA